MSLTGALRGFYNVYKVVFTMQFKGVTGMYTSCGMYLGLIDGSCLNTEGLVASAVLNKHLASSLCSCGGTAGSEASQFFFPV